MDIPAPVMRCRTLCIMSGNNPLGPPLVTRSLQTQAGTAQAPDTWRGQPH